MADCGSQLKIRSKPSHTDAPARNGIERKRILWARQNLRANGYAILNAQKKDNRETIGKPTITRFFMNPAPGPSGSQCFARTRKMKTSAATFAIRTIQDLAFSGMKSAVRKYSDASAVTLPSIWYPATKAKMPAIVIRQRNILFFRKVENLKLKRMSARAGIMVIATITDPRSTKVLVNARGLKSFPSAPVIVKTGKKLIIVVIMAARTALATSLEAR